MTLKAYLSQRRWRRLGWPNARMLAEVVKAYRLYNRLDSKPLPEMLDRMKDAPLRSPTDPTRLVKVVDWFLYPRVGANRCMPRTAILLRMLARRGYDVSAVFGVSKKEADLEGHAWIELDGEPLAEHEDPGVKYAETFRFESK